MSDDLWSFALRLAQAARAVTLPGWRSAGAVRNKDESNFDPVTEADVGAERAMRALIEAEYPDHGIKGEELAERVAEGRLSWSLDPIDGTRSYICGLPTWVTLIALLDGGEPVLGVIDAPRLDELYIADESRARLIVAGEETPLRPSGCRRLAEARLSTTDANLFAGADADAFERVRQRARLTRFGHDGYAYARVADGSLDLVIEAGLKPL